jgi:hypothetical protein
MEERIARLRTHQKNIDRYQGLLLKVALNRIEMEFLERRLSDERLAMAKLEFFLTQIEQERPLKGGLPVT